MKICSLILLTFLACLTSWGCDSEPVEQSLVDGGNNTSVLALTTPPFILRARAIDPAGLTVDVTVNGTAIEMTSQGNEWTGSVLIPVGEVAYIELVWSWKSNDGAEPLKLAVYRHTTEPITESLQLPLTIEDYDTTEFNDDGDGVSNFDELQNGSDPLDNASPGDAAVATDTNETNTPIDVVVKRVDSLDSPIIDGRYDSIWSSAYWTDNENEKLTIDNLIWGSDDNRVDGETEFRWVALHDDIFLYVFVLGEKAEGSTLFADSEDAWHDDTIELFLDGDNSKGSSYDGVNDYDILIPHLKLKHPLEANNFNDADGRFVATGPWPIGLEFVTSLNSTNEHYWEIRIELGKAGIVAGQPFGIDLHYSDDQDGGDRDAKWSWNSVTNDTWDNPGTMGTAILE